MACLLLLLLMVRSSKNPGQRMQWPNAPRQRGIWQACSASAYHFSVHVERTKLSQAPPPSACARSRAPPRAGGRRAAPPPPLVVETYVPLETQPMHGQFSGRNQPVLAGSQEPARAAGSQDPAMHGWVCLRDPACGASSAAWLRTSLRAGSEARNQPARPVLRLQPDPAQLGWVSD